MTRDVVAMGFRFMHGAIVRRRGLGWESGVVVAGWLYSDGAVYATAYGAAMAAWAKQRAVGYDARAWAAHLRRGQA